MQNVETVLTKNGGKHKLTPEGWGLVGSLRRLRAERNS